MNLYRFFLVFFLILMPISVISCDEKRGVWTNKWIVVGKMNKPRSGAGAVVVGNRLYIIGGIQGLEEGFLASCEWADIDKNGKFKKFNYTTNLVIPRGFIAAVEYNSYVYAIGGANGEHGSNLLNSIERAKINSDGSIGPWILEKNKMFSNRRGGTAVAAKGYIYAIGGFNGEFLDTVERAKVLEDGSLGKWELVPQIMNERRYIHGSAIAGNYIYAMGGHEKKTGYALNNVEYTYIDEKGELAEWQSTSSFDIPRFLTSAIAGNGYIFVLGGYNGKFVGEVEMAKINPDGSLSTWNKKTPLHTARASMSVASYKDYLYVIGGAAERKFENTIERATISEKGELGNHISDSPG